MKKPTVITVSGTNGKGSVVAALEAIYSLAGYRVGAFTSPHLLSINERIRVGALPVANAIIDAEIAKLPNSLSFFEKTFHAAINIFNNENLDLIILEVGIGGRLDITNSIDPDIAIITSIDLDHCEKLGATREAIALEKAGIMRANIPVICGDPKPPKSLLDYAKKINANLFLINQDFFTHNIPPSKIFINNSAIAIKAVECLQNKLHVSENNLNNGIKNINIKGRLELVKIQQKSVLFDVAHNPAAIKFLADFIKKLQIKGKIYALSGMMKEKDIEACFANIEPLVDHWYLCELPSERSATYTQLMEAFNGKKVSIDPESNPSKALKNVLSKAKQNDLIIVFGSFVLVGELLGEIKNES